MRYANAGDLLPPELLQQVQKYAPGTLLYVPAPEMQKPYKKPTGYQRWLKKRNQIIINSFRYGESIQQLAEEHYLSVETVRKIVYTKQNSENLRFRPDKRSAEEYAAAGLLEEWAYTLMTFERGHKKFADKLYHCEQQYFGPIILPIDMVKRNTGPEKGIRFHINAEIFERDTLYWMEQIEQERPLPPILIGYENGMLVVNCYNSMLEALRRKNVDQFSFILRVDKENLPVAQKEYPFLCKV